MVVKFSLWRSCMEKNNILFGARIIEDFHRYEKKNYKHMQQEVHEEHIHCTTRELAVRSSLPTVMRTGVRWNVFASRLTDSGQVALTKEFSVVKKRKYRHLYRTHTSMFVFVPYQRFER